MRAAAMPILETVVGPFLKLKTRLPSGASDPAAGRTRTTPERRIPAGSGQVVTFMNQISGLPTPTNFEGMLRLSTTSAAGLAVIGLRGRYNERGEFLITSTPPAESIRPPANLFPHIVDGAGYSTQFVLLRTTPAQASTGTVQFYTQSGQPMEVSVR